MADANGISAFDYFQRMSFANVKFPYRNYRVRGAMREHVHEYPHAAGGAPEKLGRKLYEVHVSAFFYKDLLDPTYKQIFTTDLNNLRALYEDGQTAELIIPHIGGIQAYCCEWEERASADNRSGVDVEMVFREDQASAFLILQAIQIPQNDLSGVAANFGIEAEKIQPKPSIFDKISQAALTVLALKDQFDLYTNLVISKIDGLISLCREADRQVQELNQPVYVTVLEALLDLWMAAQKLHDDVKNRIDNLRVFTVPVPMTVGQVSSALYGDSSRGGEIMQLNVLADPLQIPAGTTVRYYVET